MYSEAVAAPSWFGAKLVQAATSAMSGALRRTWLHPLLKRLLPKQGQVRGAGMWPERFGWC